jgi:methionyl aminopeptidase
MGIDVIALRTERELDLMVEANRIVGFAHRVLKPLIKPGVETQELDAIAEDVIRSHGAEPAFKGYHGYPAAICISINEQVVHGIPGKRQLADGDIVSIDIGVKLRGYYGDQAITRTVGAISDREQELLKVTRESLFKGIENALSGGRLGDISGAVQRWVEQFGFSVVRQFVGHGIGRKLHEDPAVPNYAPPERNPRLRKGMVLAIEPMVNMGTAQVVVADDGWTASAADGLPSAHFEHVVAITHDEARILTMAEEEIDAES